MATPQDHRLLGRDATYSAIPVTSMEGIHDLNLFEGSVNGDRLAKFITNCLLSFLQPFNWINHHSVV